MGKLNWKCSHVFLDLQLKEARNPVSSLIGLMLSYSEMFSKGLECVHLNYADSLESNKILEMLQPVMLESTRVCRSYIRDVSDEQSDMKNERRYKPCML